MFLTGLAIGVGAMGPLCAYLWCCIAPMRDDALVGRARKAALAKASAKKRVAK